MLPDDRIREIWQTARGKFSPSDLVTEMVERYVRFSKLGGWGIDLHIHDNHFISLICGVPQQVYSRGILQDGFVNHVHTQYVFDDPSLTVSAVSGGIAADGLAFSAGFEIYLERATLLYSAGTLGGEWISDRPLTVVSGGKASQPKLKGEPNGVPPLPRNCN